MQVDGFRTGLPFGYLLFAILLLGLFICGIGFFAEGVRLGRTRFKVFGMLALVAMVVLIRMAMGSGELDLSTYPTDAQVIGEWKGEGTTLALKLDHTFECAGELECNQIGRSGSWGIGKGSSVMHFTTKDKTTERSVVSYNKALWLTERIGDPDVWSGHLTLQHQLANHSLDRPAAR